MAFVAISITERAMQRKEEWFAYFVGGMGGLIKMRLGIISGKEAVARKGMKLLRGGGVAPKRKYDLPSFA